MNALFVRFLTVSISASAVILVIILIRGTGKGLSHRRIKGLWGAAALRLMIPVTLASALSFLPQDLDLENLFNRRKAAFQSAEGSSDETAWDPGRLESMSGLNDHAETKEGSFLTSEEPSELKLKETLTSGQKKKTPVRFTQILPYVWLSGTGLMLLYLAVNIIRLKVRNASAVHKTGNIYWHSNGTEAYVFGIIKPVVYLPYGCPEEELAYVTAHEQVHIRLHDPLWKMLGYLILSVYWFNPFVWLGFLLFSHDLEYACDETVACQLKDEDKAQYAEALLHLSSSRTPALSGMPVSFGEANVVHRIRKIVKPRKVSRRASVIAVALIVLFTSCSFFTGQKYTDEYQYGTDHQFFMTSNAVMKPKIQETENGCVFVHDGFIYGYDEKTGEILPLCAKSNCLHEKETDPEKRKECNACLEDAGGMDTSLMLYGGSVYVVYGKAGGVFKTDEYEGSINLVRISLDGAAKDLLLTTESMEYPIIHRGYLYYFRSEYTAKQETILSHVSFCRRKVDNGLGKEELILDPNHAHGLSKIQAYGKKLYLTMMRTVSNQTEVFCVAYDTESGEAKELASDGRVYYAFGGSLYRIPYDPDKPADTVSELRRYDETDGKETVVLENIPQGSVLGYDGKYFYLDQTFVDYEKNKAEAASGQISGGTGSDSHAVQVYDRSFRPVDEIRMPSVNETGGCTPVGGEKQQYRLYEDENTGDWGLIVVDKSEIGTLNGRSLPVKQTASAENISPEQHAGRVIDGIPVPDSQLDVSVHITYSDREEKLMAPLENWTDKEADPSRASIDDVIEKDPQNFGVSLSENEVMAVLKYTPDPSKFEAKKIEIENEEGEKIVIETAESILVGECVQKEITLNGYYLKEGNVWRCTIVMTAVNTEAPDVVFLTLPEGGEKFIGVDATVSLQDRWEYTDLESLKNGSPTLTGSLSGRWSKRPTAGRVGRKG